MFASENFWTVVGAIASTISALSSLVAISFVAVQLRANNRIAQAQLLNELERDIARDTDTYWAISSRGKESQEALTETETAALLRCLSFFERVNVILETGVLKIDIIDRIFAGRFFVLLNNLHVQKIMGQPEMQPYMRSLQDLHHKWSNYRQEQGHSTTGFVLTDSS